MNQKSNVIYIHHRKRKSTLKKMATVPGIVIILYLTGMFALGLIGWLTLQHFA